MNTNPNSTKQPKFSILRPLGDLKGVIADSKINYEDLWKHDQYIHVLPEQIDISTIKAPILPKKPFFMKKKVYEELLKDYEVDLKKYSDLVAKSHSINNLHELHKLIKQKNKFTCFFCGFQDKKYIEIHHLDSNHFNNTPANLTTACTLCHRQHHLLWLSVCDDAELGVANIDYLPQTELNHLQRIAIVMKDDPDYAGLMGKNGKLGSLLNQFTFNFSRPLHAFMIPDSEKKKNREVYISAHKLENPQNGQQANFKLIELALDNLSNLKPSKPQKDALDEYDTFIGLTEAKKNDQNASEDDIRNKNSSSVRELMAKYDRLYQDDFEKKFNEDKDTFTIFELGMALKSINYDDFKKFEPKFMFLLFKDTIFSEEQIQYYKTLDYFKVENWGFGDN